ncbi:MAG: SIS domain-containing protein [Actinobacteria bacterium]|nr:SIS domain-containing protein [Actinomycetota bacterium]
MCGIVAVLRRPSERTPPALPELLAELRLGTGHLRADLDGIALEAAASHLESVDAALRGVPGIVALLDDPEGVGALAAELEEQLRLLDAFEAGLDADGLGLAPDELEAVNAALVRVKDAHWAVERDRLRNARAVGELAVGLRSPGAIEGFASIQVALASIDRLEVRGRDSAGVQVLVQGHGLDLDDPVIAAELTRRVEDRQLRSGAMRVPAPGCVAFVYKAAAEIGELGDNVAALRRAVTGDALLHRALTGEGARVTVLGHTRWASVGIISEANAHPLDQREGEPATGGAAGPHVAAALNGDVDNFADLVALNGLALPPEVTTDAKVIPVLVARGIAAGQEPLEAFRTTVASFEGSVAIGAQSAAEPERVLLALRGSGQALYVGLAQDCFVVASEPYGLVEETGRYLRLDGEMPGNPDNPGGSRGQVVALDASRAGSVDGIERLAYDGTHLPVGIDEIAEAQITTRDIDRGTAAHFLLKEITEAPASFRKTLRGKLVERADVLTVELGRDTLPDTLRVRLRDGSVRQVVVVGQGTAAVAGQSLVAALRDALGVQSRVQVDAMLATELSGFRLAGDMSDTLVVAISQSGTTTDTNRTVDLARARGAAVISIVNRRNSDLVDRSDGVLYTSDGRDVEMSVASTKAFYAQVAAGFLLAFALADEVGAPVGDERDELLRALRELPDAMAAVLDRRPEIAMAAHRLAPSRRYWAVVGNGRNRIAAQEIRIKCSELCYKSIACDGTEDKKHIDLSAEPLVLVCAAGLSGSNADDVAKELAIYRAHKAAPVAIASEGDRRFAAALDVLRVPAVHPELAFVLSAMAGHLFGYEAALAIDASARPLREARAAIEAVAIADDDPVVRLQRLPADLEAPTARFFDGLRTGAYDGTLEAATAVRLASLLRYATGVLPLDAYAIEYGKVGTPGTVVEDLTAALTSGIEALTRPVDAIKHQAKTVTVGISRSDETLLQSRLVREVLAAGASRDELSYRVLRTLVDLDAAVDEVVGFTRYRIDGDPTRDDATISVVDRGGLGARLRSRTDDNPALRGTKQTVAAEREVFVTRGRVDGRTVAIVPEVKGAQTVGLVLLHLELRDHLSPDVARGVLSGYRHRYTALRGAVTETEPAFDDALLVEIPVADLLTLPIGPLADWWRARA